MANGFGLTGARTNQGDLERFLFGETQTAPFISGDIADIERYGFYGDLAGAAARSAAGAAQQQSLADVLAARARGEGGPSIAELQLQQTLEANRRAAAGQLASLGRQINPALAQRLLLQQQAQMGQQAAGQGAVLRAKEQLASQEQLAGLLNQMRSAEGQLYGQAGQTGLGQERLQTETELNIARENQRAEEDRQRRQAAQDEKTRERAGEAVAEAGKFALTLAEGGKVEGMAEGGKAKMPKKKLMAAHAAAKKALKSGAFKQYGDRAEEVAYATFMKQAKGAAEGALAKMDNKKNDTVPAMLSAGEIVIPRSVVSSPNPPLAAAKFVEALLNKMPPKEAKMEALKAALGKK